MDPEECNWPDYCECDDCMEEGGFDEDEFDDFYRDEFQ